MSVAELQSRLEGNAQALDRSVGDDLLRELRTLVVELEIIVHTVSDKRSVRPRSRFSTGQRS